MPAVQLWSFLLDGIEIKDYVLEGSSVYRTKKSTEADVANLFIAPSVTAVITPQNGQSIVISRGDTTATEEYIFRGVVERFDNETSNWVVDCVSEYTKLKTSLLTKSYDKNIDTEAGEVSAIAEDIFTGANFTVSTVATGVASGDVVLDKFISRRNSRSERLEVLAELVGYLTSYDYQNAQGLFQPIGHTQVTTALTVGGNVYNIPLWQEDSGGVRNVIYVDGAFVEDSGYQETFDGDGAEDTFQLTNDFAITQVKVTVDSVVQILGVEDSGSTFDYSFDSDLKRITFQSGSIPASGTDNIVVDYTVKIPYTSVASDDTSIETYNGGVAKEESFTFKDLLSVNDSDSRAEAILERLKTAPLRTKLLTDLRLLNPGNLVEVNDINNPQYNDTYVIQSIKTTYPNPVDQVEVGDVEFNINDFITNVNDRLRQLEGDNDLFSEILRQIIQITTSMKLRTRELIKESFDVSTTTDLYWDSATNGTWDDFNWADDTPETFTEEYVIPGNNTFEEYIYDTDYYDSVNSVGVTWNTSTKTITISDVLYTKRIALGVAYQYFTVSFASISGTSDYTVEISGDNKSTWQTVTQGLRTLFSSSDGSGVYIRVTNNAGSGWPTPFGTWGTVAADLIIANTYSSQDVYLLPGIKVILEE
jgi:hypothetical protein